ncbi:MAG TPA: hypothetical protein VN802_06180 [Stellaceae bacterium]|nr:hypothetical protein [Stellaceae bacterium]
MGITDRDHLRVGNASHARLYCVRPDEITIYKKNGVDWVEAGSGGASTFETIHPAITGKWWRLPAGNPYDDRALVLHNDTGNHWLWEPRADMPLADFEAALLAVNKNFVLV